jgi:hypothetical protein
MGNKAPISSEDINKIFENLNMNFPLLEQRESEINIWLKDIRSKEK